MADAAGAVQAEARMRGGGGGGGGGPPWEGGLGARRPSTRLPDLRGQVSVRAGSPARATRGLGLESQIDRKGGVGRGGRGGLGLTFSIGMTADMDLASENAATRKKGVSFLQDLSQAMKSMGGTIMAGINYSSWPRKLCPGEDKEVLTERAVQGVKEAIKSAEDCDVLFCVEVVNRFEHFMMNTAAEGIAFCERVGSPNCKLLLDTFHMNIEEDSLRGSILQSKGWLALPKPTAALSERVEFPGRRFSVPCGRSIIRGRLPWSPFSFPAEKLVETCPSIETCSAVRTAMN